MKLLIISDIHANINGLRAVLEKESDSDLVVCAGDCVDYGLDPHAVVQLLRQRKILTVAGNHDHTIVNHYAKKKELEQSSGPFEYQDINVLELTDEDIQWLAALPEGAEFDFDGYHYCMYHTVVKPVEQDFPNMLCTYAQNHAFEAVWNATVHGDYPDHRRIIIGHTHQCMVSQASPVSTWLNPGSLSYRVGLDSEVKGADYLTVVDGIPYFHHLSYDTDSILSRLDSLNLSEENVLLGRNYFAK